LKSTWTLTAFIASKAVDWLDFVTDDPYKM
jgi:hypothetical protein